MHQKDGIQFQAIQPLEFLFKKLTMTKDTFTKKLKKAVKTKINIQAAEKFIGQKPVMSTIEDNGWDILRMANIIPDEQHIEKLPDLSQTTNVIYWKVKEEKSLVKIAGLWWDKNEELYIFYGIIYPP